MERKKIFMLTVITIFIVLYIKIIFGTIQINSKFEFQGPSYNVTINGEPVSSSVGSIKKTTIIPYLLCYNSEHGVTTKGKKDYQIKLGKQVDIRITPFRCYSMVMGSKQVTACLHDNTNFMVEDMDENEYSVYSIGIYDGKHIDGYEGEFMNDITYLLDNKGNYSIVIKVKYKNIESEILLSIEVV